MRLHRYTFFLMSFILFSFSAFAQIVIDSNEYNIQVGSKHTLYSVADMTGNGIPVNVGTKGGPQNWSFSLDLFPGGETIEYTVVTPSSTPYANQFPNSDHVWYTAETFDTTAIYNFFNKTSSGLFNNGFVVVSDGLDDVSIIDPPSKILPFPAALNSDWTNTEVFEFGVPGAFSIIDSSIHNLEIDAWGTVSTPKGSFQCLRIFDKVMSFTSTYSGGNLIFADSTRSYEYFWYAENIGFIASISSDFDEPDPNFISAIDVTFRTGQTVAVKNDPGPVNRSFHLLQNHPNPFNPSTTIGFQLPQSMHVRLKIYDVTGREIQTLLNEVRTAGHHELLFDGSHLPSGIYLCELKAEKFSETRKMVLAR